MPEKRVGLIGCGTIGGQLALAVDSGRVPNASITALFDVVSQNAFALRKKLTHKPNAYEDFEEFLHSDADIIVEAASQQAVKVFAKAVVTARKDLMIMSVGALADQPFLTELLAASNEHRCSITIPTGAIAGIDAIRSVRELIAEVKLTTTKNPKALAGAPYFQSHGIKPEEIRDRTVIYSGPASEAVKLFPANVNVAAVLSLAGIGAEKTQVSIVADPNASTNKHEISVTGSFGEIQVSVNNVPSPGNPKTSYLAVLSAVECLRSICDDSLKIGT
jgi:aspartate dehydrogenase